MITDSIRNAELYRSLGDGIAEALDYLASHNLQELEPGRHDIHGDDLFIMVIDYDTAHLEEKRWEAHRKYIDVQYVTSGIEQIGWAQLGSLKVVEEYDQDKDIAWYKGKGDFVTIPTGTFMILYPHDAHMPGVALDQPASVRKVVVKVRVPVKAAE